MGREKLQFYYRQGCHLCDDMWQLLMEQQAALDFDVEARDIDTSVSLVEKYGHLIPVLVADGDILCNYYLDPVALKAYLGVNDA